MRPRKLQSLSKLASDLASTGDDRTYKLAAVGIRNDGVIVSARNIRCPQKTPTAHAEVRLAKKLTPGSVVIVSRIARGTGLPVMAKPCRNCENALRSAGVDRVYYTTSNGLKFLDL